MHQAVLHRTTSTMRIGRMMSPFELAVAKLASRVGTLDSDSQVALLACAAEALIPRYLDWCADAGVSRQDELLRGAVEHARGVALGTVKQPSRSLLMSVEAGIPSEPSDRAWFTAAQDCWMCADSALRVALHEYDASDASWYLLEPVFQSVSESLFGLTDVGSLTQNDREAEALADPRLAQAIAAINEAIDVLQVGPLDSRNVDRVRTILAPIGP